MDSATKSILLIPKQNNTEVLKHANDVMHWELKNGEILFVIKQNREEPHTFTVVSDRNYSDDGNDTNGLEGVRLTFADPEDFKKHFPHLIPQEYEMADESIRVRESNKKEYYPVAVRSVPPVSEQNPQYAPENVLTDELETIWAVKKVGARLILDYGKDIRMRSLWIAWSRGNIRQFKFTVATGKDSEITKESKKWRVIPHLKDVYSSGKTDDLESYKMVQQQQQQDRTAKRTEDSLPDTIEARYLIIQVNGGTLPGNEEWAAISRVEVSGHDAVKSAQTDKKIEYEKPNPQIQQQQQALVEEEGSLE